MHVCVICWLIRGGRGRGCCSGRWQQYEAVGRGPIRGKNSTDMAKACDFFCDFFLFVLSVVVVHVFSSLSKNATATAFFF